MACFSPAWSRWSALALLLSSSLGVLAPSAAAQAPLIGSLGDGASGFGPRAQCLSRNDDGSSAPIDITRYFPDGLRFFTETHRTIYVNTNGNITFSEPADTYTPEAFPVADQPMIAPFWADVDIRKYPLSATCDPRDQGRTCSICAPCHNPSENGVWWQLQPGRLVVTWDRVGYYECNNTKRMSFQLVLTAAAGQGSSSCVGGGDFDVEFRFNRCEWEVGEASGDANHDGICQPGEYMDYGLDDYRVDCTPAQSGFDAGNERDFVSIQGSRERGISARLCAESNVGERGVWRFQIRSGAVLCPDAGRECSTGAMGVCGAGRTQCVGSGTSCVPDVSASEERCNALDDDCDGTVDDGDALCDRHELCIQGQCQAPCFEFGCSGTQVCAASGRCVDAGCEEVACPDGQRCADGACVGACEGVACPAGRQCRAGRCVDVCDGLACDDCTVCDGETGACAARCQYAACSAGETCLEDGRCVATACAGVDCAAGTTCRDGACVDACAGAVCPTGQECEAGECVAIVRPDLPSDRRDGGGRGGSDGGRGVPNDPGCGCRAGGARAASPMALGALALLGALAYRRRRRAR